MERSILSPARSYRRGTWCGVSGTCPQRVSLPGGCTRSAGWWGAARGDGQPMRISLRRNGRTSRCTSGPGPLGPSTWTKWPAPWGWTRPNWWRLCGLSGRSGSERQAPRQPRKPWGRNTSAWPRNGREGRRPNMRLAGAVPGPGSVRPSAPERTPTVSASTTPAGTPGTGNGSGRSGGCGWGSRSGTLSPLAPGGARPMVKSSRLRCRSKAVRGHGARCVSRRWGGR